MKAINFIYMTLPLAIFLSTYITKLDDKNRVSVPAQFRAVIESKGNDIIYAYQSFANRCIEVCTLERISYLEQHIENLDIFSEERDALATAILAGCEAMQIDAKGRISISERLLRFVGADKELAFAGKGKVFEIWNKEQFAQHFDAARLKAKSDSLFNIKCSQQSKPKV